MQGQEGTVVIMVALLIAVLVGIAALAVDVGYIMTAKNELQNIADSAALAAAGQLGKDYEDVPFFEQKTYVCDSEKIISIGRDVASKNRSTGEGGDITVTDSDVEIGTWAPAAWGDPPSFKTPVICNPNAVRVTAHRDGSNPIATFFARIFRIDTVPISDIRATAVLFPVVPDGKVFLPLGISEKYFFKLNPSFRPKALKFRYRIPVGSTIRIDKSLSPHLLNTRFRISKPFIAPENSIKLKNDTSRFD